MVLPRRRPPLLPLALELADPLDEAFLSDWEVLLPVWEDHHHHPVDLEASLLHLVVSLADHHQDLLAVEAHLEDRVSLNSHRCSLENMLTLMQLDLLPHLDSHRVRQEDLVSTIRYHL